ncbi:MAG: hypothetical protein ACK56I_32240, partial [bacterium]
QKQLPAVAARLPLLAHVLLLLPLPRRTEPAAPVLQQLLSHRLDLAAVVLLQPAPQLLLLLPVYCAL